MLRRLLSKLYSANRLSKLSIYLLIAGLAILISLLFFLIANYFTVKFIHIEKEGSNNKIIGLDNLTGKNIYFLSEKEIKKIIDENNPEWEVTEIRKVYPASLFLKITHLLPLAELKIGDGYVQLAESGKILSRSLTKTDRLPTIEFYQTILDSEISPGENIGFAEVQKALFFLNTCKELNLDTKNIAINGSDMIVFNLKSSETDKSGGKIIFSLEKDKNSQVFDLEAIITQFKVKGQSFQTLDFRFAKPIVKL